MKNIFQLGSVVLILTLIMACAKISTIQGIVQEIKGGIMVDGVVILEEDLPPRTQIADLVGKTVQIQGNIKEVNDPPQHYTPGEPVSSARQGPYQLLKNIQSIKIVQ